MRAPRSLRSSSFETRVPSLESAVLVVLRVPQDEDEHSRQTPYSLFTQPSSFPRRVFAPGFCFLASRTRKEGWRSAERRSGACEHRLGLHITRQARRLARRLASHNA